MGCGTSSEVGNKATSTSSTSEPAPTKTYNIKVEMGANVKLSNGSKPPVVMLFGGPGARKGLITEKIHDEFNYTVLSAETLILKQYLVEFEKSQKKSRCSQGQKPEEAIKCETKELFSQLKVDEKLTLKYVLDIVLQEIQKLSATSSGFLVDILPNHKILLRGDSFVAEAEEALQEFEKKNGDIALALCLDIPENEFDDVISQQEAKKSPKPAEKATDGKDKDKDKKPETSDEADKSKTRRRYQAYLEASKPLLSYFDNKGKVVKVHVNAPHDWVWQRVQEIYNQLSAEHHLRLNTVIVFAFNGLMAGNGVDLTKLGFDVLPLQALLEKEAKSESDLGLELKKSLETGEVPIKQSLQVVKKYVHDNKVSTGFVVDVTGVKFNKNSITSDLENIQIMFHNPCMVGLSGLVAELDNRVKKADKLMFRSVSTTYNEFLVFPDTADEEMCTMMAKYMASITG